MPNPIIAVKRKKDRAGWQRVSDGTLAQLVASDLGSEDTTLFRKGPLGGILVAPGGFHQRQVFTGTLTTWPPDHQVGKALTSRN